MAFDFDNEKPIYLQLLEQIQIQIITERYPPGSKLPSVRDLATSYHINPNTVGRSLQILESKNLIITDRTTGKYVTDDINRIKNIKEEMAREVLEMYWSRMQELGYSKKEAKLYLEQK